MAKMLSDIYVCPSCHGDLDVRDNTLNCSACKSSFGIHDGVPSFCPPADDHIFDKESFIIFEKSIEKGHFWFKGRNRIIKHFVSKNTIKPGNRLLEIGTGAGQNLVPFVNRGLELFGIDVSLSALQYGANTLQIPFAPSHANGEHLPFADGSFSCILLLDVIEHLKDESALMREAHRVLCDDGFILVYSPGDPKLFSSFDRHYGHHRRYTPRQLQSVFDVAGLKTRHVTYTMAPIWVPALIKRKLTFSEKAPADADRYFKINPVVNAMVDLLLRLEIPFIKSGLRLPVGTSVLGIATKV